MFGFYLNMAINNVQNITFTARIKYPAIPYQDLVVLIKDGYTYTQIAEIYNVPLHVVVRLVKSYNIQKFRMKNKLAGLNNEEVLSKPRYLRQFRHVESDTILHSLIKKLNLNHEEISKSIKF